MRTLKVIAAILIALALVAAEGLAMGILSVDRALSEGTIKKSIVETGVVDDVIGEALRKHGRRLRRTGAVSHEDRRYE